MVFNKHFLLTLVLTVSVVQLYSQENKEGKTKSVTINAKVTPIKKPTNLDINSAKGFKEAYKKNKKKKSVEQIEAELKNKGILTQAKINEERWSKNFKAINEKYKRVDQHLGDFRSNSKYVRIICRDFQYPDGDRVTIYINNIPVVYNIVLTQTYQEFKIPLEKGINKIAFKALNQGTSGPNTAAFKVFDDTNTLISSNEWNLATGAEATLLIVKDK